ncbi:MAG: DUF4836 family protein [Bacteroidales bacterium]|nr:DUF4836 family protein [Bacteroidales bacterium]
MKKNSYFLLMLAVVVAMLLPACSGNKTADAGDLLATIPSDASLVVVVNSGALLEKADCKVSDDKIEPGADVKALLERMNTSGSAGKIEKLLADGTGIDPTVMAVFQVGYYYYITGFLADPAKFKEAVEKDYTGSFSTEDGIDICANVAVSNSRFWINMEQGSIDSKEIKHFTALDTSQSFLNNNYSDNLKEFSKDVEGWGNINGMLNTAGLSFQDRATAQVTIQTLFEDASSFTFSIEFDKGVASLEAEILNSKGKVAKFQLPTKELDVETVASVGGTSRILAALSMPAKMISKLTKEVSSKSPSVLGEYLKVLQGVDGTAACAMGTDGAMRGVITTTGNNIGMLTDVLGQSGINVNKEGNILRLSKGEASGPGDVATLSKDFKGAMFGLAISDFSGTPYEKYGFTQSVLKLIPDGDGIKIDLQCKVADENDNILLTLIRKL